MQNVLTQIGNVPITSSVVASMFPHIKQPNLKISDLEKKGEIIRLRRGLFVVNPEISGKKLSLSLIANHLCSPSYVSMNSALRYYGLIPEAVYVTQSMTIKTARSFTNAYGQFDFTHIDRNAFHIGITQEKYEDIFFLISTPEKALCDLIANIRGISLRYRTQLLRFLEYDLRFDMSFFKTARIDIFKEYAAVGKKSNSIITLIKWIEDERSI